MRKGRPALESIPVSFTIPKQKGSSTIDGQILKKNFDRRQDSLNAPAKRSKIPSPYSGRQRLKNQTRRKKNQLYQPESPQKLAAIQNEQKRETQAIATETDF
ncbi:MAG: hypothetical protein ACYS4W_09640 [Planctomycetota bacterium]